MAKSGSSITAVAERYARSLYELAADAKAVPAVENDLSKQAVAYRQMSLLLRRPPGLSLIHI